MELLHKTVLTLIPMECTRMLLLCQWQRLHPAVMKRGKEDIVLLVRNYSYAIFCVNNSSLSQAGRCEERDVFWQSKTALSLVTVCAIRF